MAANSRTANNRKRPTTTLAGADADFEDDYDTADEVSPAEAQEIEAADDRYVTALLAGEEIRVIPPGAWRQSWQAMLRRADFAEFADRVVHPDDLDLYEEIDPTNDEFEAFVISATKNSGESLGKSRGPVRSSRHTRRR